MSLQMTACARNACARRAAVAGDDGGRQQGEHVVTAEENIESAWPLSVLEHRPPSTRQYVRKKQKNEKHGGKTAEKKKKKA